LKSTIISGVTPSLSSAQTFLMGYIAAVMHMKSVLKRAACKFRFWLKKKDQSRKPVCTFKTVCYVKAVGVMTHIFTEILK
jgi:hypothetical protein